MSPDSMFEVRFFNRIFYFLTAWLPRRLPRDAAEWNHLKDVLVLWYGLPDEPKFWTTVAGHVSSTPAWKMRRSYQYLANVALRMTVNEAASKVRKDAIADLEAQLARAIKAEAGRSVVREAVQDAINHSAEH